MPEIIELPPSAASLSESMRDLGYSLETAIADLVDNSISAGASKVEILCDLAQEPPCLVIVDNGCGMDRQDLIDAMRHGSRVKQLPPPETDLGRFGLGLKTASFSQCRRLTVISGRSTIRSGAEWNLDRVATEDRWLIEVLNDDEVGQIPHVGLLPATGTMVVWRELDRLSELEGGASRDEVINEKLELVRTHLSLVFHRFLSGEIGKSKLALKVNGIDLQPFDPFCRSNSGTQVLPKEVIKVDGHKVEMQAYVLPHHSRLSKKEFEFYKTRSDFLSNQGAFVYRNGRLMAWGDWFRLVPKGEATKLGRVQIDFPSALDEAWTIDIKKSRAKPPLAVREHLRRIIPQITTKAVRVHRGRGQQLFDDIESPLWNRYADNAGIKYAINLDHPLVVGLRQQLNEKGVSTLNLTLDSIAASLPIEMIYSDYSTSPKEINLPAISEDEALARLRELRLLLFPNNKLDRDAYLKVLASMRQFDGFESIIERYLHEEAS